MTTFDPALYVACHGCRAWARIYQVDDNLLPPRWLRRGGMQLCPICQVVDE